MRKPPSSRRVMAVLLWLLGAMAAGGMPGAFARQADDGQGAEAKLAALKFFENEVRPLLTEHCVRCHGEERQKSGLRLDSLGTAMAGGNSGPAVVPGHPEESLMVEAIRYEGLEMPPTGPLPEDAVNTLVQWVEMGAPWPGAEGEAVAVRSPEDEEPFSEADRSYWAFQPVVDPDVPVVDDSGWGRNAIDAFVFDRLNQAGLAPAPEADRRALIRRATFDLTGLPPTPEEVAAFLEDDEPGAFERLVDRLLDSPRYGERWGRYWLDLVRFAESNGYRADEFRPNAWRYRDYVIESFNEDKPYDQFVREQIAGDELMPDDPEGKIATGYLRLWAYESNQRDVEGQWDAILDDITDVTADVFLGMGMGCAHCHDHKYDPILQRDYYRLRGFFAAIHPRDEMTLAPTGPGTGVLERRAAWEALTADLRAEMAEIERPHRERGARDAISKFQPEMQALLTMPPEERSPREQQLAELAFRQVQMEYDKVPGRLKGEEKARWEAIQKEIARFDAIRPPQESNVDTITDLGSNAPPMTIPGDRSGEEIRPGFLTILDPDPAEIVPPEGWPTASTGRRTTLARWMTRPENPLTTRVIVNRLWQYHFGRGIVETASDFGRLGEPPSHPELLDWLTSRFIENGWSLKTMHRLMMTSATYRQSAFHPSPSEGLRIDPENRLLWRMPTDRLEAEPIRDAMLAVSGELNLKAGGPSVDPDTPRRSIYTTFKRNTKDPILGAFDIADGYVSTSQRNVTTTATQSLLMINGPWVLDRARAFADRLRDEADLDDVDRVDLAFQLAYARPPTPAERDASLAFLVEQSRLITPASADAASTAENGPDRVCVEDGPAPIKPEAWVDFCHVILNSNEFLYVD